MNELKQIQANLLKLQHQIDKAKQPRTRKALWGKYYRLIYREAELLGRQV